MFKIVELKIKFLLIAAAFIQIEIKLNAAQARNVYKAACIIPYYWKKDGTTKILLGKERRPGGEVWHDFCGRKDKKDKSPLDTALRETREETAQQIKIMAFGDNPRSIASKNGKIVTYFLPAVACVESIKKAATSGKYEHVEKTDWKWVDTTELLANLETPEKFELKLWPRFIKKLLKPEAISHLQEIIKLGKERAIKK